EDVLVCIEGGEYDDARVLETGHREDLTGGVETIQLRHTDVHQHDVRPCALHEVHRFAAVRSASDDLDVGLGVQQRAESLTHHGLIIDDRDSDARSVSSGVRHTSMIFAASPPRRRSTGHPLNISPKYQGI